MKLFDIFAANQYQGGKCIFSPHISCLARKNSVLQRAVWPPVLIIIICGLVEERKNREGEEKGCMGEIGIREEETKEGRGRWRCSWVIQGRGDWVEAHALNGYYIVLCPVDLICLQSFIRVPNDGRLRQRHRKMRSSKRFLKMDFNSMQRATPQNFEYKHFCIWSNWKECETKSSNWSLRLL